MENTIELIAKNIKRLRKLKGLSQKEICNTTGIPQGQYSRIENAKVEPSVSTIEKLAKAFEIPINEIFITNDINADIDMSLMEKISLIDTLGEDEQKAIFKMIDLAIANKRLRDNLQSLIEG